jgi:hypothetical protein
MRRVLPASYDTPLGLAYSNVVSDDKEFNLVYLGWMLSSKLFLGKTKVEHVSCVVSSKWSVDPLKERWKAYLTMIRVLLITQNWVNRRDGYLPLVIVN